MWPASTSSPTSSPSSTTPATRSCPWSPTTRWRRPASTTALNWRPPRQCSASESTSAGCAGASPCSTPTAPMSTRRSTCRPTSPSFQAPCCTATPSSVPGPASAPTCASPIVRSAKAPSSNRRWANTPKSAPAPSSVRSRPCHRAATSPRERARARSTLQLAAKTTAVEERLHMELVTKKRLQLFSGRSNLPLAQEIAECLDVKLGEANLSEFANGELHCRFGESVRGSDVFILQSHARPVNTSIMEQAIMIDAAKRASAKRITAVCPFYGYARQDRKASGREPITARLLADILRVAGPNRVGSVDLHPRQIQGFFHSPVAHPTATPVLTNYIRDNIDGDVVVVSPDAGRVKVAERFSQHLNADLAFVAKRRPRGAMHQVEALNVVGEVNGRVCVIIDDMIDTAGTICAAAAQLVKDGAAEVYAMATHAVLSDPAIGRLKNSPISKVVVTNTLPLDDGRLFDKIEVLSVAQIVADALDAVFEDTSVSEIFGGENQA